MAKFLLGFFSFGWLKGFDFLPPLLLRLFLAPMLWFSGSKKLGLFAGDNIDLYTPTTWFHTATYDLSVEIFKATPMPAPEIMNGLIGGIEVIAAIFFVLGFSVRWLALPLLIIMSFTILLTLGERDILVVGENMLMSHRYYINITSDPFTVQVMYFLMMLSLFFTGAGRFFSLDWLLYRRFQHSINNKNNPKTYHHNPFNLEESNKSTILKY